MLVVKNPPASAGDVREVGSVLRWGGSPGGGNGTPPQYSCLENPTDRGAWWATVCGFARVRHDLANQPPEEIVGEKLHDIELGNDLMNMTPEA